MSDSTTDEGGQLSIGMSFAATAQQLAGDTNAFKNVVSRKEKRPRKLVVGESVANKHVQSVFTVRSVDIFGYMALFRQALPWALYTVSQKSKTPISCPELHQIFTDFHNSFTVRLSSKFVTR